MIKNGIKPENIFVLTYMEAAAKNFKEKISLAMPNNIELPIADGAVMLCDTFFKLRTYVSCHIFEHFLFVLSTRLQHSLTANITVLIVLPVTRPVNLSHDLPKSFLCHSHIIDVICIIQPFGLKINLLTASFLLLGK